LRKQLSKSDKLEYNNLIQESFNIPDFFDKKSNVLLVEESGFKYLLSDFPVFFFLEDKLVPSLKLLLQKSILKQVVVDMGAVKFVASGADIMRPGIVDLDNSINKDEFVVVVDITHHKPLCLAIALSSGAEIKSETSGKVLKNIHYIGDKLWNL